MCLPAKIQGFTIQKVATIVGCLLCLSFGLMVGITPLHADIYKTVYTPLTRILYDNETKWLLGYLFISAAIGSFVFGFISPKIGPKSVLMLSGLLQIGGWFCIHFAYNIGHIHLSRMFVGSGSGAALTVLPTFIWEIGDKSTFSKLTPYIDLSRSVGILIGIVTSAYLPYDYIAIIGLSISILFVMSFPFVQESPLYYKHKGDESSLEKSLRWFRGIRDIDDRMKPEFVKELQLHKDDMKKNNIAAQPSSVLNTLKTIFYSMILTCVTHLSGVLIMLFDADDIFPNSSQTTLSLIILATAQLAGAALACWLVAKITERVLLYSTSFLCCVLLISIAAYKSITLQQSSHSVILILLSVHFLLANIGLAPLSIIICERIQCESVKSIIKSLVCCSSWLILFLLNQNYHHNVVGTGSTMYVWIFGVLCGIVAVLAWFFLNFKPHNDHPILTSGKMTYSHC